MKRIIAILTVITVLFGFGITATAAENENMPYDSYTYWQESGSKYLVGNKTMYEVYDTISCEDLSLNDFTEPTDIIVSSDNELYILDGNNSRIFIVSEKGELISVINDFSGEKFSNASGIYLSAEGKIYIADTENKRVLIGTKSGELVKVINSPDSEIIPKDFEFLPLRLTVDKNGYIYVLSKGSFYGALVFAPDGSTEGFFGANKVNASVGDVLDTLWNRWFLTDEQRASSVQKIPYQFSDLVIDDRGLLYTTTGALSTYSSQEGQIRCLGPAGTNIMKNRVDRKVSDSDSYNFADKGIAKLAVGNRVQDFVAIDVCNGYIYALDATYGKIFVYSESCELLTVFGGGVEKGTQKGTFKSATSIAVSENKVYVLDSVKGNITVFIANDYCRSVQKACYLTNNGKYVEAQPIWEEVIKQDRNNQLAYRGLARAALASKQYDLAVDYSRKGLDRGIYDQAFEYIRNDFLEKNITLIIISVIVLICFIVLYLVLKKKGKIPTFNGHYATLPFKACVHPFESFREIKYSGKGSIGIAFVLLGLFYVAGVLKDFYSGFAHSDFSSENYNSLLSLLGSVGVVVLWVVCNWLISVLAEGKGRMKEVFIVACYSLVPQIIGSMLYLVLSNILLLKEATVLVAISTVCLILTGIVLCIGTMIIHEFDFFRFIWTTLLTIVAMAVVIFLCFMIVILLQQFYAFIRTVFIEITYR